jgi:TonB family protein
LLAALVLSMIAECGLAADDSGPIDVTLTWSASVAADGQLTVLKPDDDANPELYKRFDADVRKWRFTPGKVNGVPTATNTTLTVKIRLTPVPGGFRPEILDATSGVGYGRKTAPKYPEGAVKSHRGGGVLLRVTFDGEGKVRNAEAIEGSSPKAGDDIERAALAAMKHWTFKPESIGGRGYGGVAIVPLCFSVGPGPETPCRFIYPGSNQDLRDGGLLAVDPLVHLERPKPAS